MNYLTEIRAFYDWLVTNPLPADAQALWHALMHINNKCAWQERFTVANTTLLSILGFSRPQLDRMRNLLIQVGRIEYEKRQGRQAGVYRIIPFVSHYEAQPEIQVETQVEIQPETQPEIQTGHNQSTLNKLNKTKQNINIINISSSRPTKKQKKEMFANDSIEMRVARYLLAKIRAHLPSLKEPDIQAWAKEADLMLRVDKRPLPELRAVIDFCQSDPFWRANILSMKKLRQRYDQLNAKRLASKKEGEHTGKFEPYRG